MAAIELMISGNFLPGSAGLRSVSDYGSNIPQSIYLICVVSGRLSVEGTDCLIVDLQIFQIFGFQALDPLNWLIRRCRVVSPRENLPRQFNCFIVGPVLRFRNTVRVQLLLEEQNLPRRKATACHRASDDNPAAVEERFTVSLGEQDLKVKGGNLSVVELSAHRL